MKILERVTVFSAILGMSLAGCSDQGPPKPAADSTAEMQKSMESMTKSLPKDPKTAPGAGGGATDGK